MTDFARNSVVANLMQLGIEFPSKCLQLVFGRNDVPYDHEIHALRAITRMEFAYDFMAVGDRKVVTQFPQSLLPPVTPIFFHITGRRLKGSA